MQQLVSDLVVGADGESQHTVGSGDPSGSLDEGSPDGVELVEAPESRAGGRGGSVGWLDGHLELAVEVVGEDGGEQVELVAGEGAGGDVVELPLGLQLGEDAFLGSAAVVEADHGGGGDGLVGEHHGVAELGVDGLEQVELDGLVGAPAVAGAQEDEAVAAGPAFGLPAVLEVGQLGVDSVPTAPVLNALLEPDEALEGDADGELHAQLVEGADDLVAEEGAVEPDLEHDSGQHGADLLDAGDEEVLRAPGVVDVAWAVEQIENLTGLRHGAKQRVVASLPFLLAVEAHRGPLGPPSGAEHRAIEVQSEPTRYQSHQSLQDQLAAQPAHPLDAGEAHLGQAARHRRDVGQAGQPEQPAHHRIVAVVARIA